MYVWVFVKIVLRKCVNGLNGREENCTENLKVLFKKLLKGGSKKLLMTSNGFLILFLFPFMSWKRLVLNKMLF